METPEKFCGDNFCTQESCFPNIIMKLLKQEASILYILLKSNSVQLTKNQIQTERLAVSRAPLFGIWKCQALYSNLNMLITTAKDDILIFVCIFQRK